MTKPEISHAAAFVAAGIRPFAKRLEFAEMIEAATSLGDIPEPYRSKIIAVHGRTQP